MLNLFPIKNLTYLLILLLFVSCSKNDGGEPEPEPKPVASLVSNLVYSPASLNLSAGAAGSSNAPTLSGTLPVTYSLTTSPGSNGAITIDAEGKIKAATTLPVGSYSVSVTAANAAGSAKFDNIYTINVAASVPQNLNYSPNSSTVNLGTAVTSAVPTISSTSTVTYSISTSPASSAITINNQGVISATNALTAGTYSVTVTATNTAGSKVFANAYSIIVNTPGSAVTFNNDIKMVIQNNCGSCHINGPQTNYGNYTNAKNNINEILNRINLPQGAAGMMPNGGTKLSQATINLIQKWKDDGLIE